MSMRTTSSHLFLAFAVVLAVMGFTAPSPVAAEPCYIQLGDGSCAQRYWQDPDTFILESYPSHTVYNPSSGVYEVFTCHLVPPNNQPKLPECSIGGVLILPEPITLRAWCGKLWDISRQAHTSFYGLGICPAR